MTSSRAQVGSLTKQMNSISQKTITSSYGFRLLQTASGKRNISSGDKSRIDVSTLKEINYSNLSFESSHILGAGRFGQCATAIFHQYVVCVKTVNDSNELFLREAFFFREIGCFKNIPFLFGIIKAN